MKIKYNDDDNVYDEDIPVITQHEYKEECLDNDLTHLVVDIKIDMMDYIRQEGIPLIEYFDIDQWKKFIRSHFR